MITEAACVGLLSNDTAMDRLKVQHHVQAVKPLTSTAIAVLTRDRRTLTELLASMADTSPALL